MTTKEANERIAAEHLHDALNSMGKCVRLLDDQEAKELLYHAGMTIRTLQHKFDPAERVPAQPPRD